MTASGLADTVANTVAGLRAGDLADLARRGLAIRQAIASAVMPEDLNQAIVEA